MSSAINDLIEKIRGKLSCFGVSTGASSIKKDRTVRDKQASARNNYKSKMICLSPEGEEFLPEEIIIEILSWLPVKCVLRCKRVCKMWNTIIQDRKFIEKHMLRGKIEMVYGEKSNSNRNKETFRCLSYIDGIVLETFDLTSKYRIRNSATKQVLELPDPEERGKHVAMGFVSSTNDYKLLYVYYKKGTLTDLGIKVLTVGSDLAWRPLDISLSFDSKTEKTFVTNSYDISYIVKFCEVELGKTEIIGLVLEDESFMKIKIPQDFRLGNKQFVRFIWKKKLSLGFIIQELLHVWVLENYKKQKWSEKKIIPLAFIKDYPNMRNNLVMFGARRGRLGVSLNFEHRLTYDTESKKVEFVTTAPPGKKILYSLLPSLVSLPGMHPEEKLKKSKLDMWTRLVAFGFSLFPSSNDG